MVNKKVQILKNHSHLALQMIQEVMWSISLLYNWICPTKCGIQIHAPASCTGKSLPHEDAHPFLFRSNIRKFFLRWIWTPTNLLVSSQWFKFYYCKWQKKSLILLICNIPLNLSLPCLPLASLFSNILPQGFKFVSYLPWHPGPLPSGTLCNGSSSVLMFFKCAQNWMCYSRYALMRTEKKSDIHFPCFGHRTSCNRA